MKSFWLGAALERERGKRKCLSQRIQSALLKRKKTKSIFDELRGSNATCRSLRSLWHFFCWLPSLFHCFLLHAAARKFFLHHFGSPWKKPMANWNCWPRLLALQVGLRWNGRGRRSGRGAGVRRVRATPSYCSSAVHFIIILRAIKMKCQTKWQQFWLNFFVYDSVDKK